MADKKPLEAIDVQKLIDLLNLVSPFFPGAYKLLLSLLIFLKDDTQPKVMQARAEKCVCPEHVRQHLDKLVQDAMVTLADAMCAQCCLCGDEVNVP